MAAKGAGVLGQGWGRRQLITASGPDVNHGILSCFKGMWLAGLFHFHGYGAETQLRLKQHRDLGPGPEGIPNGQEEHGISRPQKCHHSLTLYTKVQK